MYNFCSSALSLSPLPHLSHILLLILIFKQAYLLQGLLLSFFVVVVFGVSSPLLLSSSPPLFLSLFFSSRDQIVSNESMVLVQVESIHQHYHLRSVDQNHQAN